MRLEPFVGTLEFSSGLQIISADNAFGKSLAAKTLAWCLGVEPIFGIFSDDATCFPQAVLERLKLPDDTYTDVLSSECEVKLIRDDGQRLRLRRAIKGETAYVHVEEQPAEVPPPAPVVNLNWAHPAGIPPSPPSSSRNKTPGERKNHAGRDGRAPAIPFRVASLAAR